MSDELRRIEREIRDWTARPPERSPRVARTRVLARIEGVPTRPGWLAAAAAAALVVALAFGLLLRGPATHPGPPAEAAAAEPSPGLLVYELESGTKLYLALAVAATGVSTPEENATLEGNR